MNEYSTLFTTNTIAWQFRHTARVCTAVSCKPLLHARSQVGQETIAKTAVYFGEFQFNCIISILVVMRDSFVSDHCPYRRLLNCILY